MLLFFTGALDAAYMGSSPLLLGHTYGLPVRIVAIANAHRGSLAVVGRGAGSEKGTPKLGTVFGSDGHVLAHRFSEGKGDAERPLIVNLPPEECVNALKLGMVDYAALWEPYVSLALENGGSVEFSDRDLGFEMFSFLVATESALAGKRRAVEGMVDAHLAAIDELEGGLGEYASRLRMIFGPELPAEAHEKLLEEGYRWPRETSLAGGLGGEVLASLAEVHAAHVALGTVPRDSDPDLAALVSAGVADVRASGDEALHLGYSNSIMCATFHVADLAGLFEKSGLGLGAGRRRVEERIARLAPELQDDLRLCSELIARDPELVIQKLGRMNEQLFRRLARASLGGDEKSFAATIESLRSAGVAPKDILSWADSIRSIRNVAAHHQENLSSEEAGNAFSIFLNVAEWFDQNRAALEAPVSRCPRCATEVEEVWVACPKCGMSLDGACEGCGAKVEPGWRVCPRCGRAIGP